jgi:hypothetical protein
MNSPRTPRECELFWRTIYKTLGLIMSKISHGSASTQPHTAPALLRELRINDVSVDKQKDVLRDWLRDHRPDQSLWLSLRSNGYGILLDERYGRVTRHTAGHG